MFDIPLRPLKDTLFNPLVPLIPARITPLHLTLAAFIAGLLSCYITTFSNHTTAPITALGLNTFTLTPFGIRLAALAFWFLNRILDCLDGALARHRGTASDLGGFLDLLGDFVVYSVIPIACGVAAEGGITTQEVLAVEGAVVGAERIGGGGRGLWLGIAVLEATFHVNNFVLFFVGAVVEKRRAGVAVARLQSHEAADVRVESERGESGMSGTGTSASKTRSAGGGAKEGAGAVDQEQSVKELTSIAMRPALIEGAESGIIFTIMLAVPQYTAAISWAMAVAVAFGVCQRTWWVWGVLS